MPSSMAGRVNGIRGARGFVKPSPLKSPERPLVVRLLVAKIATTTFEYLDSIPLFYLLLDCDTRINISKIWTP